MAEPALDRSVDGVDAVDGVNAVDSGRTGWCQVASRAQPGGCGGDGPRKCQTPVPRAADHHGDATMLPRPSPGVRGPLLASRSGVASGSDDSPGRVHDPDEATGASIRSSGAPSRPLRSG